MIEITLGAVSGALLIGIGWFLFNARCSRKEKGANRFKHQDTIELPDVHLYGGSTKTGILTNEYPSPSEEQVNISHLNEIRFPYLSRQKLFSSAEHTLLKALNQAFYLQPYHVFTKVRLADVLNTLPSLEDREKRIALDRIRQKRLDFLICQANTTEIVGAITLDATTDKLLDSQIQDKFIDIALATAQIPLLHLPSKANYPSMTLRKHLNRAFSLQLPLTNIKPLPACPQCGATLRRKQVKKGVHLGKAFWVCADYPVCKIILPLYKSSKR